MSILFAVWEIDPFFKVGGLGDVARSLPGALKDRGVDIRCVMPFYDAVRLGRARAIKRATVTIPYAGKSERIEVIETKNPANGVPVYLLRNKRYFSIIKHPDTYALWARAIVTIVQEHTLGWTPEIIHCNDLHTGLVPLLVREGRVPVKTILTIHNLAHQGPTATDILEKLGVDPSRCRVILWEIRLRKINLLLEGIVHADVVTTVSPTYAREILTEEYGHGLEEVLRGKEGRIFGILNGIDDIWRRKMLMESVKYPFARPGGNSNGVKSFLSDWETGKWRNKRYLQRLLGLKVDENLPLLAFIGRLDPEQKGIDLIHKMLRRIDLSAIQFVLLGTGNTNWEERFLWLDKFYPKEVSCTFKFDETLAHQIYAGADFLLIPSKYEPCGLIQMIAMFFGTLPIARGTGGLSDSIKDGVNGFLFRKYSSHALEEEVKKALAIWRKDRDRYRRMVKAAMATDFSWGNSAAEYLSLYDKLLRHEL